MLKNTKLQINELAYCHCSPAPEAVHVSRKTNQVQVRQIEDCLNTEKKSTLQKNPFCGVLFLILWDRRPARCIFSNLLTIHIQQA